MFFTPTLEELNLGVTLPALSLSLGLCILLLVDVFLPKDRRYLTPWLALAGIVVAFVLNLFQFNNGGEALMGMFVSDNFSTFLNMVVLAAAGLTILLSVDYNQRHGIERGEFYILLLLSTVGAMLMGGANDLVVVFVALEVLSIPLYIMAAFRLDNAKSEESGMKYFILGAFASAFLVYGAAMVYGATGTTNIPAIFAAVSDVVASESSAIFYLLVGTALLIVGLGFKVAVVPFHMWTPDVYEGAPTPVTAYMSVGAKIGGFAALLRVLVVGMPLLALEVGEPSIWQAVIALLAALTMIVGNLAAISQRNIKRMLAYSSIAHAGYIMMAIAAGGVVGVADAAAQGALIYLLTYTLTNLGAFAVVIAIEKNDGSGVDLDNFIGLSRSKPMLALLMGVFMISLTGIPPTAGFIGKWLVFQATIDAGLVWLAVVGVVTSVVSAYYYVRVIVNMYLVDGEGNPAEGATRYVNWVAYAAFAGTLILGIFPVLVVNLTNTVTVVASVIP